MARSGSKKVNFKQLEAEYELLVPLARRFSEELERQLAHLVDKGNIPLSFPIQRRIKSWPSIAEKLERQYLSLSKVSDLQDVVGLRLMLQFRRDVRVLCDLISSNFTVIRTYDTADRLKEDQFGYSSVHLVVELPESWLSVPSFRDMRGLVAEVQVRTTAQHMWAAASHTLQYKHEEAVPPPVRRAIYRVSALLETVDLEFERVLKEREQYRSEVHEVSVSDQLNVDMLEKLLDTVWPAKNKWIGEEGYSDLLEDLSNFNILSTARLLEIVNKHREEVLQEDSRRLQELGEGGELSDFQRAREQNAFFAHVGLTRTALKREFGKPWFDYLSKKYSAGKPSK